MSKFMKSVTNEPGDSKTLRNAEFLKLKKLLYLDFNNRNKDMLLFNL